VGRNVVRSLSELKIKLFVDGADLKQIREAASNPIVSGCTTNPSLMKSSGITDYETFAKNVLFNVMGLPVSFEVFADDFPEMDRQACKIASWGENVYVKIPVTNTRRESSMPLIRGLSKAGIKVNVTAVLTLEQVRDAAMALTGGAPSIISVFSGRIADTGRDPVPMMEAAAAMVSDCLNIELLWASSREVLNIFQANDAGCDIITVTADLLAKLKTVGKDLAQYSLETVQMFHDDAVKSGYVL
jgi:transaldolase